MLVMFLTGFQKLGLRYQDFQERFMWSEISPREGSGRDSSITLKVGSLVNLQRCVYGLLAGLGYYRPLSLSDLWIPSNPEIYCTAVILKLSHHFGTRGFRQLVDEAHQRGMNTLRTDFLPLSDQSPQWRDDCQTWRKFSLQDWFHIQEFPSSKEINLPPYLLALKASHGKSSSEGHLLALRPLDWGVWHR